MDALKIAVIAMFAALLFLLAAPDQVAGQQVEVRHYRTEIHEVTGTADFQQLHVMIGRDGRMGVVVMRGPRGTQPVTVAVSGPRTYTDVDDTGVAAFCFTVDETEGFAAGQGEQFIGKVSCFVWLNGDDDDVMIETGSTPFGQATSPEMRWCGEDHGGSPASPPSVSRS